jgi:hypothetical protein
VGAKSADALSMFSIVSRSPRRWRAFPPTAITMRSHAGRVVEYGEERCDDDDARDVDLDDDDDDDADDDAAAARSSRQDAVFRRENRLGEIMMASEMLLLFWCFFMETIIFIEKIILLTIMILRMHSGERCDVMVDG